MSTRPAPPCPHHPDAMAEVACNSCNRPLCAECWAFDVNDAPWCRHCVEHIHDRSPMAFPLAFLGGTGTLLTALFLRFRHLPDAPHVALGAGLTLLATAGFLYRRNSQVYSSHVMVERSHTFGRPHHEALGAYRSAPRRARVGTIVPPVSGKLSTLVVLMCLLLPAAMLPALLSVPAWIAVDGVLVLWWLTLVSAFAMLLYRGTRLLGGTPINHWPRGAKPADDAALIKRMEDAHANRKNAQVYEAAFTEWAHAEPGERHRPGTC